MLRQHHLRIPDVKAYLRVFDRNKPTSPNDWAAQESMLYEPGYLIFCLEQVAAPAGLSTFSKKSEDQGDTFRVKDLCVVISKDEGQCMVVNVTASAYEFRVLDALMQEKATKAILDGKDFNYLACRPVTRLGPSQVKALYQVGSAYAQGGSRRSLTVEGSPLEEPVIALLDQLGAKLTAQVGKPVLDIGSICHMIFTPQGRQDDNNKTILKSVFAPLKAEELALGELAVQHGIMTEQAIRHEQTASPTASQNAMPAMQADQPFATPQAPSQPAPFAAAPPEAPQPAPPVISAPAASSQPSQSSFEMSPAMQQISYSNLQLPPQSEIIAPEFTANSLTAPADPAAYAFDANPAFVPSAPEPAPEVTNSTPVKGRYDDTPPWATASADALTAVLIAGDNRPDQMLTAVRMAPPWYAMSHDVFDSPQSSIAPLSASIAPKEDFSAQFFNDYQQGFAGEAAVGYAESEFEKERRLKEEFEAGKQERLKEYFGDEHYDKFVKGDTPAASNSAKADSWDLNASNYTTPAEPAAATDAFESSIFSNAARGTIETNPEATFTAPPAPEAPVDNDSWMDYQPPAAAAESSQFETAPMEAAFPATGTTSGSQIPSLGLIDAISPVKQAQSEHSEGWAPGDDWHSPATPASASTAAAGQPSSEAEWSSAVESSFATGDSLTGQDEDASSLFNRLTNQLSQDGQAAPQAQAEFQSADQSGQEIWHQGTPVAEPKAADKPVGISSGGFWSSMDPTTSLFSAPEEDTASSTDMAAAPAPVAESTAINVPANYSMPAPAETPATIENEVMADSLPEIPQAKSTAPDQVDSSAVKPAASISDSQQMQTRIRPRDYSSPLRRSSELGGGSAAPQPPAVPAPSLPTPPVPTAQAPVSPLSPTQSATNIPALQPGLEPSPLVVPSHEEVVPKAHAINEMVEDSLSSAFAPEFPAADFNAPAATTEPAQTAQTVSEPIAEPAIEPVLEPVHEAVAAADTFAAPEQPVMSDVAPELSTPTFAQPAQPPSPPAVTAFTPAPAANSVSTSAATAGGTTSGIAPGEFDSGVRKAPPAQDARLMMNEMATLMSKLEQQVAKAANKLSSRAEELKVRLNRQVEDFLREAAELEKHGELNLTNLSSELRGRLENLAVDVQSNLSKESEGARSLLSDLDASGLETLEAEQRQLSARIIRDCDEFRSELEKLTTSVQSRLNGLIASRNDELAKLSESILEQLKESHDSYSDKVTQRFERFRERMAEENASITQSLERNMRSMVEEIDSSLDRACEKLRSTKVDLEQTISHTVAVSEMAVAQKTKHLLAETLLPKLNEQKEILRTMIHDMGKQVAMESSTGLVGELAKLDNSINRASEQLKRNVEDCLSDLETSGRGLKSGLEETFKRASLELLQRTQEVGQTLKDTERRMLESDQTLKSLAEATTVDEPELSEERNHALAKLGSLKQQANKDLASTIESSIENMENESEKLFGQLTNKRADFTATVRDSSETNLDRVRQALAAATAAIQSAREKHME